VSFGEAGQTATRALRPPYSSNPQTRPLFPQATSVVKRWPRVTSKRITADLRAVTQGTFDFSRLEHLFAVSGQDVGEDE